MRDLDGLDRELGPTGAEGRPLPTHRPRMVEREPAHDCALIVLHGDGPADLLAVVELVSVDELVLQEVVTPLQPGYLLAHTTSAECQR